MQNLLIVAATKIELISLFPEIPKKDLQLGEIYTIKTNNKTLSCIVCGIGPLNAAIYTQKAILSNEIHGVINIGIAGAFDINKIPIGSITISNKEIWPEFGLKTKDQIDPRGLNLGLIKLKNGDIIYNEIDISYKKNMEKMGLSLNHNLYTTVSLTVAGVSGDLVVTKRLKDQFNPDIENMEGFSVAYVSLINNLPFIEIRSISNQVGERGLQRWHMKKALSSLTKVRSIFL